ncbi:MAG: exonuclease SbcCD subunit D [Lachnospiraceae bacterium]|nr:exonuclease SbcCD subunit D [Lachnospiraceae bacterium]
MRFIHTADLHLGMEPDKDKPWSKMRGRELWDAFSDIVEKCREDSIDLLLIAGDLFHKQPLVREVKEVSRMLSSIPNTKVVIIAGNHDYISGTSGYRGFKWPDNVYFLMSDKIESVYFEDIDTEVFGLSYHVRNIYEPVYDGIRPTDPARTNILLGHGGEPSNIPIDWKGLERAGFDYVAMGHLHKPMDISENIRYAGSLEPLDKNETGDHGYIAGEIVKAGFDNRKSFEIGSEKHITRIYSAKRSYIKADIEISCEDTYGSLRRKVMALLDENGRDNFYVLRLYGEYDPDITFDMEGLDDLGHIASITDETRPKLDYDRIAAENAGNVIGMFIDRIRDDEADRDRMIREKALYYGVMALSGRL